MRNFKNSIFLLLITVGLMACKSEPEIKTISTEESTAVVNELDENASYAKAEFEIEGMTCAMGCAKTIEKKLAKMDGVKSAKVDFDTRIAMVEYNESMVTPSSLEETVSKAGDGYKAIGVKKVSDFGEKSLCDKACCEGKTDAEKANCDMACCVDKTMACAEDCKKDCCADKKKA